MRRVVWKFPLRDPHQAQVEPFSVLLPEGASILSLQIQGGMPTLWAEVIAANARKPRAFAWLPTGLEFESCETTYIGSLQWAGGALVYHLYALGEGVSLWPGEVPR